MPQHVTAGVAWPGVAAWRLGGGGGASPKASSCLVCNGLASGYQLLVLLTLPYFC
jgi:hypothetical protein